ncbi:MAG: hypothetical protein ACXVCP_17125 [Bdellovibrio sp.]
MKKTIALLTFASVLNACSPGAKETVVLPGTSTADESKTSTTLKNNMIEGTVNGGGGKGVLCKKSGQETLETLDLYEGRVLYGQKYSQKFSSLDEALSKIQKDYLAYFSEPLNRTTDGNAEGIGPSYKESIEKAAALEMSRTREKIKFIGSGKTLNSTNDANEAVIEEQCSSAQIAVYYDENVLLVNKQLWDKLDYINQAALLYHEVLYKKARERGETSSVKTRRIVANLLSDDGLIFKLGVPKEEVYFVTTYGCPSHDEPGAELVDCDHNLAISFYMWQEIHDGKPEIHFVSFSLSFFYFSGTSDGLRKRIVIKDKTIEDIVDFTHETGGTWKLKDIYKLLKNEEIYTDTVKDPEIGLALRYSSVSKLSHIEDLKNTAK